jgi:hypothetical protein
MKNNNKTFNNLDGNNNVAEAAKRLQKTAPTFTDEVLELLWDWIEAKQSEKLQKQLESVKSDMKFQETSSHITH